MTNPSEEEEPKKDGQRGVDPTRKLSGSGQYHSCANSSGLPLDSPSTGQIVSSYSPVSSAASAVPLSYGGSGKDAEMINMEEEVASQNQFEASSDKAKDEKEYKENTVNEDSNDRSNVEEKDCGIMGESILTSNEVIDNSEIQNRANNDNSKLQNETSDVVRNGGVSPDNDQTSFNKSDTTLEVSAPAKTDVQNQLKAERARCLSESAAEDSMPVNNLSKDSATMPLERPKRIFQKPPEEYLPIVEENTEDEGSLEGVPSPPDGGWGWVVVFSSFMIHVFADGFTYTLGIFYVHLLSYYDVSKSAAAWIVSILVGVTLGSGPISGALVNKFGCRPVTIGGAVLASFMLFVSIFAKSIYTLYFTIGIGAGMGFGLIYLPAIVCVTGYFEKRRSFATGIAVCGSGLGTFVFSPLVEYLIASYNWKGALIVISGLVLNCVFFGALFRPLEDNPCPSQRRPRPQYSNQYSMESQSPDAYLDPQHLPRIEVSANTPTSPNMRKNFSDASLTAHISLLGRRRGPRHLVTGSIPAENLDISRIKSHGCLNPAIASLRHSGHLRMTASQPLFPKLEHGDRSPSPSKLTNSQSGLLYRKDIFYRGSLMNIPEYKRSPSHYRESIVIRPGDEEELDLGHKVCGCIPCPRDSWSAIHSLTDFGLLADPIFQLFALSNFFTSIGFYAPYVFIVDRALEIGIVSESTSTLLAVVGFSNTISRVVLGYIADMPRINRLYVYNLALTICGLGTCFSIWMTNFASQIFYAAVFGSTSGAYVGLTSVVLVDLLGMEKLTNAFGLLLLFQGIASVIGPPLCGSLYESSQNYNYTFLLAGTMIAISGLMLFAIPCIKRCADHKKTVAQQKNETEQPL